MRQSISPAAFAACFAALALALLLAAGCSRLPPAPAIVSTARFVSDAACAGCHAAEFRAHQASNHMKTLRLMDAASLKGLAPDDGLIPPTHVALARQGDGFAYRRDDRDEKAESLSLAFGSGKNGMTYVRVVGPQSLFELRMSYFPRLKKWFVTPGQAIGQDDQAGHLHEGAFAGKCVSCHAVTRTAPSLLPERRFFGVGCEVCHGPGSDHVAAMQKGDLKHSGIEKMATWSATRLNLLCAKCHRGPNDVDASGAEARMTNRFQPFGLMNSVCFQKSGDSLSCIACHAPHDNATKNQKIYEAACLKCHSMQPEAVAFAASKHFDVRVCPVNARDKCVGCHMKTRRVFTNQDIPTSMADHLITSRNRDY